MNARKWTLALLLATCLVVTAAPTLAQDTHTVTLPILTGAAAASSELTETECIHVLEAGDSLPDIAEQYDADIWEIIEANNLRTVEDLERRDELVIPGANCVDNDLLNYVVGSDLLTATVGNDEDAENNAAAETSDNLGFNTAFEDADPNEFYFEVTGAQSEVPMQNVDYARGGFSSPWPILSHVLAEPGKLMVGPDFPQAQIDGSQGAIRRVDPGNQYRLTNNEYTDIGCQEGGLIWISVQEATLTFGNGMVVSFRAPNGSNARVYIKCRFADGVQGSDAGNNIRISNYRPGYGLVQHFSPEPNGGFISAEGEMQALEISQSADSSGADGANSTYMIGIDSNTQAWSTAVTDDAETVIPLDTNWWHS